MGSRGRRCDRKPSRWSCWSRSSGLWVLGAGQLLLSGGCFGVDAFVCSTDSGCVREGVAGRCEVGGVCSYPSDGCPSGWRFSDNAGAQANECVLDASSTGEASSSSSRDGGVSEVSSEGMESETTPSCDGCERLEVDGRALFVCASPSTWFQARDTCFGCGLTLASVHTAAENDALSTRVPFPTLAWIGLTDRDVEGDWVWVDLAAVEFVAWGVDEPAQGDSAEDCGAVDDAGRWVAKRCELPNAFVCAPPPDRA